MKKVTDEELAFMDKVFIKAMETTMRSDLSFNGVKNPEHGVRLKLTWEIALDAVEARRKLLYY